MIQINSNNVFSLEVVSSFSSSTVQDSSSLCSTTTTTTRKRKNPISKKNNTTIQRVRDANFRPGEYDVICARGGDAKRHIGNINFRQRVAESAQEYAAASSKLYKSIIVSKIIDWVRQHSPEGGFVKQNRDDGLWYDVGDDLARDKVGQTLRELNHSQYKSSMKAKRRRWKQEKLNQHNHFCLDFGGGSDENVNTALKTMLINHYQAVESKWKMFNATATTTTSNEQQQQDDDDDDMVLNIFNQQNCLLLQNMKSNQEVQEQLSQLV